MNVDDFGRSAAANGPQTPDIDLLADFHAGVLDDDSAARVAAYVQTSPEAQAVLRALDATMADLGALPPVEVPEFVARRIDRALAAEAGVQQAPFAQFTAPPAQDPNVFNLDQARERRTRRTRMLTAVAAGIVVLGGGAVVATQIGSDDSPSGGSDVNVAGATYDAQTIDEGVQTIQSAGAINNDQVSDEVAGDMSELSARRQCLNLIKDRPLKAPTAVQEISYGGQAAYAFVFPAEDPSQVRVIVVSTSDCGDVLEDKEVSN